MAADDVRDEIRDVLAGWPIGSGYYQDKVGVEDASEMADALLPVVDRIAREAAGKAWDEGYAAAEADDDRNPWDATCNPFRAEAADGGGQA